ncbi:hypothetical protein EE612_003823 [Oryza sativa]|nr:hypothetical protein EE612_003823 [Oryza sativa]
MPVYRIRGVDVDFPYDAYDCQITYMDRVLESLQQVTPQSPPIPPRRRGIGNPSIPFDLSDGGELAGSIRQGVEAEAGAGAGASSRRMGASLLGASTRGVRRRSRLGTP